MPGLIIFLLGSIGITILSYQAFQKPGSHGFPRFFAFEAILGLVVLNAPYWFLEPFLLNQLISWALLLDSAFLAIHAFWVIRKYGKADKFIQDTDRISFEKTTQLVSEGPYRFIRHPMYASLLCFAWGIFFKRITLTTALLVILASLALYTTALIEERENLRIFGDKYAAYMKSTKRFIPYIF